MKDTSNLTTLCYCESNIIVPLNKIDLHTHTDDNANTQMPVSVGSPLFIEG